MSVRKALDKEKEEKSIADGMVRLSKNVKATSELRGTVRNLTREVEELTRELSLAIGTAGLNPIKIKKRRASVRNDLTPVVMWSDHHIEEVVPKEQTNGLNDSHFKDLVTVRARIISCGGFEVSSLHLDLQFITNQDLLFVPSIFKQLEVH